MRASQAALLMLVLCCLAPAWAVIETYEFSSAELEQRYQTLSAELRCPKCQNQNIADSNAPIAQDLRRLLYQQLEEGSSDEQILDHMVARYGEFVRYRPGFTAATAVLWLAPLILLVLAALIVALLMRNRQGVAVQQAAVLSDKEREQLKAMLDEDTKGTDE
jgi:cytochrome c-type biogenesis protein CcmH